MMFINTSTHQHINTFMAEDKKRPIIISVDDDPQVLRSLKNDLRAEFREDYRIISSQSANEVLASLPELKKKGEAVAIFISDQRMPEMEGVDFLEQAKKIYPEAKRVLITAYSDTDAAIKAINEVQLDYYLVKPWDPPSEKLYPILKDQLREWERTYKPEFQGIRVVGYQYSPKSHEIKDFLAGNLRPYQWLDIEANPKAKELLDLFGLQLRDLPVAFFEDGSYARQPTTRDLAEKIGLNASAQSDLYDVVIIGAGPAGLAAAVYGGSEGLKTLLIEKRAPGGQAGTSSRIENYLGFPSGLSGADLSHRAITQAKRFGVEFLAPQEVTAIQNDGFYKVLTLSDGSVITTKSIVITTGVDYRKLPASGVDNFTGAGVYYGAAMTEANGCKDRVVYVVGGGNSAGQGAVYLSKFAKRVTIVVRKEDLTSTMSSYLIDQINNIENIDVQGKREVVEACGNGRLQRLVIENVEDKSRYDVAADALFIFIGAKPITEWLGGKIIRDEKGYILTGRDLFVKPDFKNIWKLEREPYLLETCAPGVFAAGDVRAGAMNRIASAVGEGAMAIKFVHEYLAEI
jgi:thioredoxin reductase (NADPH)